MTIDILLLVYQVVNHLFFIFKLSMQGKIFEQQVLPFGTSWS